MHDLPLPRPASRYPRLGYRHVVRLTRWVAAPVRPLYSVRVSPPGESPAAQAAICAGLVLLPVAVYWPVITAFFGFRDDYSILRESVEEPGKVIRVCAMQARPIYGWLLELTFGHTRSIADLAWIRGLSALTLGAVSAALFLTLRALRWDRWLAILMAGLLVVLPSSQVAVSWAVAWPLHVALLFALGAFGCAERAFGRMERGLAHPGRVSWPSRLRTFAWWSAAVLLATAGALTYQPNALFYFAAVAAALWSRRRWATRSGVEWLVRHIVTVGIGLIVAFTVMVVAFAGGEVPASRRVAFDHDLLGKLEWFVREPLQNAAGLIALNQNGGADSVHRFATLVGVMIVAGFALGCRTRGWRHGVWWTTAFVTLAVASLSVNLVVADRWPAYRVLLPLTVVVAIAMTVALLILGGRPLARWGLVVLVVPGIWLARQQTVELFAVPQHIELSMLDAGAERIDLAKHPRVFVLTPFDEDHAATRVFLDEFGSMSTNSYWTPKEMLRLLMQHRHPGRSDLSGAYAFACGPELPRGEEVDVLIDMHKLRDARPR